LDATDVEHLRGGDGGRFRDFVVGIIRAQAHFCGIPESAIHTDSRSMKDGGADCQVDEGQPSGSSGWLRGKTIWQFKGETRVTATARTRSAVNPKALRPQAT
jgi:hypothetical protein